MQRKDEVIATLRVAQACTAAALEAIRDNSRLVQTDRSLSLAARLKDFTSLLSLTYQDITKLAVALKPPAPTFNAAISPAKDLATHLDALASCTCSIDGRNSGVTITREIRWSAEEVLNAVDALLLVYVGDAHFSHEIEEGEGSASEGAPYLVRTGVVHEAIDRARGLPQNNREAVRCRWDGILGGIDDCFREIKDMIDEDEDESDGWDGWDELLGSKSGSETVRPSDVERARIECGVKLLKFTQGLLQKLRLIFLIQSSPIAELSDRDLDSLLESSHTLLKSADDFVDALYVPQGIESLRRTLSYLEVPIEELRRLVDASGIALTQARTDMTCRPKANDLVQRLSFMKLNEDATGASNPELLKEQKWFNQCFYEIGRMIEMIRV